MKVRKMLAKFVIISLALALFGACSGAATPTQPVVAAGTTPTATTRALPGAGKTATPAYDSVAEGLFQTYVLMIGLEKLGYTVKPPLALEVPSMHLALGTGDADFIAVHWNPLQDIFFQESGGPAKIQRVHTLVDNALQGYLIDKKTADQHKIKTIDQLKDPALAKLFDADRDGKADLVGCNPGWGCERVINNHLKAYGLEQTVEHVQGSYFALMADAMARFNRGEPILYYTWTPFWLSSVLRPGQESEWLQVPFTALPEEQKVTDTTLPDGRNLGFGVNAIQIVANTAFLDKNPAARRLFEQATIPIADVNAENALINKGEDKEADIRRHAEQWIAAHQSLFDGWIAEALKAAR